MDTPDGFERRRHPRADANFTLSIDAHPRGDAVQVKDISKAGVCCFLDAPIPIMTQVALQLHIPDRQGQTVEVTCEGAVVRSEPAAGRAGYEVAVFFVDVDEEGRRAIERYVQSQLHSRAAGKTA